MKSKKGFIRPSLNLVRINKKMHFMMSFPGLLFTGFFSQIVIYINSFISIKNIHALILAALFLHGCTRRVPEILFEQDGVSFVSPEGWRLTEERNMMDSGYYASCQRKGFGSSGIFMLSWINGITELDHYIRLYREEFEKNILMKAATIQFEEPVDSIFNDMPCSVSVYKAKILGVKSRGEIFSFYCSGRTFMLVFQASVDESRKNKMGFEKMKSTFSCNSDKSQSL